MALIQSHHKFLTFLEEHVVAWPSGLRRCVQVAVSSGGVGSNPTAAISGFRLTRYALHTYLIHRDCRSNLHLPVPRAEWRSGSVLGP